jgi:hypothetical protein
MVHAGGRPRTVSLHPDGMEKLGKEMVDWVIKNDPYHLNEWYSITKRFTYKEWKTFIQRPEFVPYYEQALTYVSKHYINGDINPSIAQRFLRIYFKDVKEEENETAKFNSDLKVEEVAKVSDSDAQRASDVLSQLKAMQDNYRLTISQSNNSPAQ